MNNLLSCCGLVDARISASEKKLPVPKMKMVKISAKFVKNIFRQIIGKIFIICVIEVSFFIRSLLCHKSFKTRTGLQAVLFVF